MTDPAMPTTLRAELQDQIVRLCCELGTAGPVVSVLTFAGRLDEARLARAARLAVDAEPVLGCRFEPHPRTPVWRRRDDLDHERWLTVQTVEDVEAALAQALVTGPEQVERTFALHLLRAPAGDTLLVWVNHTVADGTAAIDCAYLVAELYSRLGEDPGHRPEPNPAPRDGLQWAEQLTAADKLRIVRRGIGDALRARGPAHGFRRSFEEYRSAAPSAPACVVHRIPPDRLARIDRLAAARGCLRNDLLLTAFVRAFPAFAGSAPGGRVRVTMPDNLRRYAPPRRRYAMFNLAGVATLTVGPGLGAGFDDTLALVGAEMARLKRGLMGAAHPLAMRLMARMPFARKRAMLEKMMRRGMARPVPPTYSNVGRFNAARLRFDGVAPADAILTGHTSSAPFFVCLITEYAGTLSLTTAVQAGDFPPERVRAFFAEVERQIPAEAVAINQPEEVS